MAPLHFQIGVIHTATPNFLFNISEVKKLLIYISASLMLQYIITNLLHRPYRLSLISEIFCS